MSDRFTVTTNKSYFQRLGDSFGGMAAGVVLIVVACGLLWWNESRAVDAIEALGAARGQVVSLGSTTPDPANKDKLVHVTGEAKASAVIADPDLNVTFAEALSVARKVEMYQWVEKSESKTQDKLGGGQETVTTYTYEKQWSETPVDSSKFQQPQGRANPAMPLRSREFYASDATLGGFKLGEGVLGQLGDGAPAKPESAPAGWADTAQGWYASDAGGMPESPQVGDVRVTYSAVASPQTISVLGRQTTDGFAAWQDQATGYKLLRAEIGEKTAVMMIKDQEAAESTLTWILRAVGTVLNCVGFGLILAPLRAIANVIPFLASIVGAGVGFIAFALGIPLSLIVIAVAWLVFRPLIGLGLLAAAVAIFVGLGLLRRGKSGRAPQPA